MDSCNCVLPSFLAWFKKKKKKKISHLTSRFSLFFVFVNPFPSIAEFDEPEVRFQKTRVSSNFSFFSSHLTCLRSKEGHCITVGKAQKGFGFISGKV